MQTIPNAEPLYEDPNAEKVLRALPKVLEQVDRPVCDRNRPIPGLPLMPGKWPEWVEHDGNYLARTPWGLADMVYGSNLGSDDVYAVTPIWNVVVPGETPYPGAEAPVPGVAVLDGITGEEEDPGARRSVASAVARGGERGTTLFPSFVSEVTTTLNLPPLPPLPPRLTRRGASGNIVVKGAFCDAEEVPTCPGRSR